MEEAEGSSPSSSTLVDALATTFAAAGSFLGGLVAGEGSFLVTRKLPPFANGDPRLRFVFSVSMADRDRDLLVALQSFLGVGSVTALRPRNERWLAQTRYVANSIRSHRSAVIPFAERFLPRYTAKWTQFEQWRQALDSYEAMHPTRWGQGPSICSVEGCTRAVRGQGLCRHHYYDATGW